MKITTKKVKDYLNSINLNLFLTIKGNCNLAYNIMFLLHSFLNRELKEDEKDAGIFLEKMWIQENASFTHNMAGQKIKQKLKGFLYFSERIIIFCDSIGITDDLFLFRDNNGKAQSIYLLLFNYHFMKIRTGGKATPIFFLDSFHIDSLDKMIINVNNEKDYDLVELLDAFVFGNLPKEKQLQTMSQKNVNDFLKSIDIDPKQKAAQNCEISIGFLIRIFIDWKNKNILLPISDFLKEQNIYFDSIVETSSLKNNNYLLTFILGIIHEIDTFIFTNKFALDDICTNKQFINLNTILFKFFIYKKKGGHSAPMFLSEEFPILNKKLEIKHTYGGRTNLTWVLDDFYQRVSFSFKYNLEENKEIQQQSPKVEKTPDFDQYLQKLSNRLEKHFKGYKGEIVNKLEPDEFFERVRKEYLENMDKLNQEFLENMFKDSSYSKEEKVIENQTVASAPKKAEPSISNKEHFEDMVSLAHRYFDDVLNNRKKDNDNLQKVCSAIYFEFEHIPPAQIEKTIDAYQYAIIQIESDLRGYLITWTDEDALVPIRVKLEFLSLIYIYLEKQKIILKYS